MKNSILNRGNIFFIVLLGIILILLLPYFKNAFYNEDKTLAWLEKFKRPEIDTTQVLADTSQNSELTKISWSWNDFSGRKHKIQFNVPTEEYDLAKNHRETMSMLWLSELYYDLLDASKVALDSMATAMKKDISKKHLKGIQALNYVVNAIQFPTYTKITDENECPCYDMGRWWSNRCEPLTNGTGCCNEVKPLGVFSPTEFIFNKTGDCDTKSLIAYSLLKRLGYDAALLIGDVQGGSHAMLGLSNVNPVIPTKSINYRGKIYYPWEVTSFNSDCKLGNMSMWGPGWRNRDVICN
ncbi:MAG: hypothetical protein LW688_09110 [Cryomorphaceae bacterium]|nr:hypothetical protein [Cryomorphaceae bacterium]